MIDESLLEFCESEPQRRAIQARLDTNTVKEAADLIDISIRNVQQNIANVKKNAARRGWSPEHDMIRTVPDGFVAKGVSTLYGDDGQVKIQWVKSNLAHEDQLEAVKRALDTFIEYQKGKSPFIPKPQKKVKGNELAVVNIGDSHFGMLASESISGDDYNLEIAGGFGPLAGQIWRIGLMGYSSRLENVMLLLAALREVLKVR